MAPTSSNPAPRRPRVAVSVLLAAVFGLVVLLLGVAIAASVRASRSFVEVSSDGLQTSATLLRLEQVLSAIRDAETGQRGYLLTGDSAYLEPYHTGTEAVRKQMAALTRLAGAEEKPGRLDLPEVLEYQRLIGIKLNELERSLDEYHRVGSARAIARVRSGVGKAAMDTLRVLIGKAQRRELDELQGSSSGWQEAARQSFTGVRALSVVGLLLLGVMLLGAARVTAERRARLAALEQERQLLEERVRERTAELAAQTELAVSASHRAEEAAAHAEEESVRAEEEAARAEEEQLRAEEEAKRALALAEELRQADERQRVALDAAAMGTWSYDPLSRELATSARSRELFGLDGIHTLTLDAFLARVHPEDRSGLLATLNRTLRDPSSTQTATEYRAQGADGSERWILDRGRAILDGNGQVVRVVGVHLDLTERRRTEEQLRHAELLTSVGRLAGGVAHEVNNQMSVVLGCADFILRRHDLPAAVRSDVQQMLTAAERSAAITAQLLAFSRRQTRRPIVLNVNAVLNDMVPVLRRTLGEGRHVAVRLADDLWSVRADPGQIGQVLLNLTINARDAMLAGGELAIETANVELGPAAIAAHSTVAVVPGPYVRLCVSDTGHGMDRDTLRRVFEPFFTTKGVGKGTGLGLSTVYGIIKSSDGYIWVYSEPGHGTTFKIYLPRADGVQSVVTPAAAPRSSRAERVLIVEDDDAVRAIAQRTLEDLGYRVIAAPGGVEGMRIVEDLSQPLDLVLTDVVMPTLGGREIAARLKALRPDVLVLFMSGYTDDDVVLRNLIDDGSPFLQKPFSPEVLGSKVRALLGSAAGRPTA